MDYVEWCNLVLSELVSLWERSAQNRQIGVHRHALVEHISPKASPVENPKDIVHNALYDLSDLGLVTHDHGMYWKVTASGLNYTNDPVPTWRLICHMSLRPDQETVLRIINYVSQVDQLPITTLNWIDRDAVEQNLPESLDPDMVDPIVKELAEEGCIQRRAYVGRRIDLAANLRGLIWATRREHTFIHSFIEELLGVGETTSIEIKRQLSTKTKSEKAEFVKDVLALANTQASGRRCLLIGFDDKTREYFGPPASTINQDHLEQILSTYTEPMVQINYKVVNYRDGIGVLEVYRNPIHLPYRVAKSVGDKKRVGQGQIFVRHGSQVEEPTAAELKAIMAEGEQARLKERAD